MTEFQFEDLSKKTVAQLREIAEATEHEALQDPAKMPKEELLAALCQALGIESGESPEESAKDETPATRESTAAESASESSEDEEPAAEESEISEAPEESAKEEPAPAQGDPAS